MTWTDATSIGGTEGTATANPLGGNPTYSYSWSPAPASPQITQTVTGLSEGTYYLDITDQNSCVRQDSVHINQPPCNDFYIYVNPSDISCYGLADGAANLIISNGTAPFSISWSSGEVDVTNVSGLSAGNYSVTVTDNSSCTTFATFDIVEPSPLSISLLPNNISCYGANDGTVDLTVTGGVFPYDFDWTQKDVNISENEDIINLNTGTYSVSVQDANGCIIEGSASITQPQPLITNPIASPISCFGVNDGSATVNTTGGTPIYSYSWTGPLGYTGSGNSISSLAPGQYFVTTLDASGCTHVVDTYIDEPEQLNALATVLDSVSCISGSDGNIDLVVTGGTEPYNFSWTGPSAYVSSDEDISGLIDGIYNFTVTDNNSCTTNGSILLGTTVDITNPVITCGSTGEIVDSDPGNCTYSVIGSSWDASASDNCLVSTVEFELTGATSGTGTTLAGIVFNLGTTTVTWTATDNSGNTDICSYEIIVIDSESPAFTSCVGSDQIVSSDVGFCSYTQVGNIWDANATDNCTVSTITYALSGATTGSGSTLDGVTFNLGTTNVIWTVIDGSGNTQTCIFNVIVEDNELPSFTSCLGSNQNVNADVGTCDYTHAGTVWDATVSDNCSISSFTYNLTGATIGNGTSLDGVVFNLGTTTVTWSATDDSGNSSTCIYDIIVADSELPQISCVGNIESCDPIVSFPAAIASDNCGLAGIAQTAGLTSGSSFNIGTTTITYEAIDASGNANTCSFDIIIHPIPTLNLNSTDISCNGLTDGSIDLAVSTSTAPYVFTWSNGEITEDIAGLSEGNYSVSVEDVYGCTSSASSSIVEPEQLSLTKIVTHVSCYSADDGTIDIEVSGGISPYSYSWSNSSISEDVNLIAPGVYSVDVTDANGCLLSNATNIVQPDSIEFQHLVTDATCNAPNGTINVQATGGTTPYNYLWSNGLTTQNLTNAVTGTYTLTLTDNNGCLAALTDSVGTTSNISAIVYPYDVSCYGESDGSALAIVQTGNAPYNYDWSNGDQTDLANDMTAGTYSVTITDAFGCEVDLSFDITQPDSLYVVLTSNDVIPGFQVSPNGNDNGSIYSYVYGGTPTYEYAWTIGLTDSDLFNLEAGTYYLTVTDENRCKAFADITLLEPNDLDIPEGVSPNGDQENDYFVVKGLESYPDNHITIYNRWGNIIYQQEGYENDWEGNNNRGEALPDGTYYVVLSVNKGDQRKTLTGYIDLRRTR
jgi:gliding motility-associated-like protein